MNSFLEFLGVLGSNVLNFPGILGVAVGMCTRNWLVAAVLGGAVAVSHILLLQSFDIEGFATPTTSVAIVVGIVAGLVGCAIRRKGATV